MSCMFVTLEVFPCTDILVERLGTSEHPVHGRDARGVPSRYIRVEGYFVEEQAGHVRHQRHVPVRHLCRSRGAAVRAVIATRHAAGGDGEAAGHSSVQRGSVGKRAPGVAGCGIISRGSGPSAGARCAQSVLDAFVLQALVERRGGRDRRSREHENGEEDADARDQSGPPRTAPRRFRACRTHEQFIFSGQGWEGQAGVRENSSTASISVRASARAVRRIGHPGRRVIDRDSRMDRREYDAILARAACVEPRRPTRTVEPTRGGGSREPWEVVGACAPAVE